MPEADERTLFARELAALVAVHRGVLLASPPANVELEDMGRLGSLLISRGQWRPDGAATTRRFLVAVMRAYRSTTADPVGIYPRGLRADAVAAYWGVHRHPVSARTSAAAAFLELPGMHPHGNTVRNWSSDVIDDPTVARAMQASWNARVAHDTLDAGSRPIWTGPREEWPPPVLGRFGDEVRNERARLVGQARKRLATELTGEEFAAADLDDTTSVLALLREATGRRLVTQYFFPSGLPDDEYRDLRLHARVSLLAPWSLDDALDEVEPGPSPIPGVQTAQVVAIAAQTVMHEIVNPLAGDGTLAAVARERIPRLRLTSERFAEFVSNTVRRQTIVKVPSSGLVADVDPEIDLLHRMADAMRARGATPASAAAYIEARREVDLNALGLSDTLLLRLSDQSASLDMSTAQLEGLRKELGTLISNPGTSRVGIAYQALVSRDEGIGLLKKNQEGRALSLVGQAFIDLEHLLEAGLVDRRSGMEVAQQLALGAAGDHVRIVERALVRAVAGGDVDRNLPTSIDEAMRFAHIARTELDDLDDAFPLDVARHVEGQIAAPVWRIRTRMMELRIELAALTALAIQLVPAKRLTRLPLLERAARFYVEIVARPEITPATNAEIATLAIWLSQLNEGWLPLPHAISRGLEEFPFLYLDPIVQQTSGASARRMNLDAASRSLGDRLRGIVKDVRVDGLVARYFESHGGGGYLDWRSRIDQHLEHEPGARTHVS